MNGRMAADLSLLLVGLAACGEPAYFPERLPADTAHGGGDGGDGADGGDSPPCSAATAGAAHTLHVENQRAADVSVLWVDSLCAEIAYNTLPPGAAYDQPTYVGHVWAFRDSPSGALIDWVEIADVEPNTVVLP